MLPLKRSEGVPHSFNCTAAFAISAYCWRTWFYCILVGSLQLISHNFTYSQHSLIILAQRYLILFSINYDIFFNWLRTSCVVSITTAATWHIWTADFWADFEQRIIIDRAINEWQNDCGVVSMPKDSIRTRVVTFDTAKHFIISIKTLFKRFRLTFLFTKQHKLWNEAP